MAPEMEAFVREGATRRFSFQLKKKWNTLFSTHPSNIALLHHEAS
jgi:hypothetical protein